MTDKYGENFRELDSNVRRLVESYKQLQYEYERTKQKLLDTEASLNDAIAQIKKLNDDYNGLLQAKMVAGSVDVANDYKKRLSYLMREIDKCIDFLNE